MLNLFLRLLFLSIALPYTMVFAQATEPLPVSLQEALAANRESGYQNKIARAQHQKAKGQNFQAWKAILPQLTLEENFMRSNDPVAVFSGKLRQEVFGAEDFAINTLNQPDALEWYTTALTVNMPLINPDLWFSKISAAKAATAAGYQKERAEAMQAFIVTSAYYDLALAQAREKAIEKAVQGAEAHRDNAQAARNSGLLTEADYLWAEVRLAELQEQLIEAGSIVLTASDHLKVLMGMENETRMLLPSDSLPAPQALADSATAGPSVENRSDVKALEKAYSARRYQQNGMRLSWLPRLNGFAQRSWFGEDAFATDTDNFSVGVNLSWQLFDGLGRWGKMQVASAEAKIAKAQLAAARQQAALEIRQAKRAIEITEKRYHVAKLTHQQAAESLRLTRERFDEGLEKSATVIEREAGATAAKVRLLKAGRDHAVAIARLQLSMQ